MSVPKRDTTQPADPFLEMAWEKAEKMKQLRRDQGTTGMGDIAESIADYRKQRREHHKDRERRR